MFNQLNNEEKELIYNVPLYVIILIAGADSNIDKSEIKEAVNIANLKTSKARKVLKDYYQNVAEVFEDKLKIMIQQLPSDLEKRNETLVSELTKVNEILPKLNKNFAIEFYESMKDIANKIANSSGGFLGYLSVGYEESKFIDLNMIQDPSKL